MYFFAEFVLIQLDHALNFFTLGTMKKVDVFISFQSFMIFAEFVLKQLDHALILLFFFHQVLAEEVNVFLGFQSFVILRLNFL